MSKKVLGINWGRPKGTNRLCLKYVLDAAEEAGCEVQLINTMNLKIGRCIGCGSCSRSSRDQGAATIECVVKDDFQMLRDAFLDADAIVCACPTYALTAVGQYKNFVDRLGPAWDIAQTTKEAMKRRSLVPDPENPALYIRADESGEFPPLDPRVNKHRPIAYIATGGAQDDHWVSLNLPMMKLLGFPVGCKVVDEISTHGKMPDKVRLAEMGRHLADACGRHHSQMTYYGDPGICPMCHSGFITLNAGRGMKAECPICGIEGDLIIENGAIRVDFPVDEWDYSRFSFEGLLEHTDFGRMLPAPMPFPPK